MKQTLTEPPHDRTTPRRRPATPERFRVARPTLLFDRFMNHFIKVGGLAVIAAVFGIFFFILLQIFPLFRGASVTPERSVPVGDLEVLAMGSDEWGELPFLVTADGTVHFVDTSDEGEEGHRGSFTLPAGLPEDAEVATVRYHPGSGNLLLGTTDGRFATVKVDYRATFPESGVRLVEADLTPGPVFPIGEPGHPIEQLAYGDSGTRKLAAAVQRIDERAALHVASLSQKRTLMGLGELRVEESRDLTAHLSGDPTQVLIGSEADSLLVATAEGEVNYLFYDRPDFSLRQAFRPFEDLPDPSIGRMDFVLGDVSVVFTSPSGEMRVFSLFPHPETGQRVWGQTKEFPDVPRGAGYFSAGKRNKAFLVGNGSFASLRYATTEDIRWEADLPFEVRQGIIAPRYDRILFLDTENILHHYRLKDSHPEASWKTYFGKIHYEGRSQPDFIWQSTGGTDEFEKKLSLVPLIIGTLKGTLYAMVFALPIALLAAIYTSQFLKPEVKRYVKPTMEIMASLPSVVLGFLAALWLAPIVSNRIPSVLLAILGVIAGAAFMGWSWNALPKRIRLRVREGYEFLLVAPFMLLFATAGWNLGPVAEELFFVVINPDTGQRVADFGLWFPLTTGLGFQQRNAAVVGFVMGFAVIPIIFTIAEDAMANVPSAFRSGSLALGASRWQTAVRVVLPTASAGIFSATMIGLGRAVGETMIVVMATGNTPVKDLNIFTGMRTLSANIAVELPEAPYLGTLYRTLFLGAMVLFLMTFLVNTIAEILRQRLREKYRAVE